MTVHRTATHRTSVCSMCTVAYIKTRARPGSRLQPGSPSSNVLPVCGRRLSFYIFLLLYVRARHCTQAGPSSLQIGIYKYMVRYTMSRSLSRRFLCQLLGSYVHSPIALVGSYSWTPLLIPEHPSAQCARAEADDGQGTQATLMWSMRSTARSCSCGWSRSPRTADDEYIIRNTLHGAAAIGGCLPIGICLLIGQGASGSKYRGGPGRSGHADMQGADAW